MQEVTPKVRISRLKNELQDGEWNEDAMLAVDVKNGKQKKVPVTKFAKSGETAEAIESLAQSIQDNATDILNLQQTKVDKAYVAPSEDADYTNLGDIFFDNDDGKLKKCIIDEPGVHEVVETTVASELKQRVSRGELTKDLGNAMTNLQTESVEGVELLAKKKNGDIVKVDGNTVVYDYLGTRTSYGQLTWFRDINAGDCFVIRGYGEGCNGTYFLSLSTQSSDNTLVETIDIRTTAIGNFVYFKASAKAAYIKAYLNSPADVSSAKPFTLSIGKVSEAEMLLLQNTHVIESNVVNLSSRVSSLSDKVKPRNKWKNLLNTSAFIQGRFDVNGVWSGFPSSQPAYLQWAAQKNLINCTSANKISIFHTNPNVVQVFLQTYTCTTDSSYNDTFTKSTRQQIAVNGGERVEIDVSENQYLRISLNCDAGCDVSSFDVFVDIERGSCLSAIDAEKLIYEDLPNTDNISGRCVVDVNGTGNYTNLASAYNGNRTGSNPALIQFDVKNGSYDYIDVAKLWAHGESKEYTIVKNTSAVYPAGACNIGMGVMENLTFYAHNASAANPVYALHIDMSRNKDGKCIFRNCRFISTRNSAIGIGMTSGYNLIFENCEFISHSTEYPAAFFHDARPSLGEGYFGGEQSITFKGCKFVGKSDYALRILSVDSTNKMVATFIDNTFGSETMANQNSVQISGITSEGFLCGNSIKLGVSSHGNNVDILNA